MKYTIKSRKLKKDVTFSIPGRSYVYVDLTGHHPGTLGSQICEGGGLTGATISYCKDLSQEGFEMVCKKWFRKYIQD